MKSVALTLSVMLSSVACAEGPVAGQLVKVFKPKGSLQCESQGGMSLEAQRGELEKVGITVKSSACGIDGQMHLAVCGADDGAIHIFEIAQTQAAKAAELGFASLGSLPDATEIPCK